MKPSFQPSARQMNCLIAIGFGSVFYAYHLRHMVIENTHVFLACQEGLDTWLCSTMNLAILLFNQGAFGGVAVVAACLHLLWPSVLLFALALGAAGFGLVMQNGGMAGFAVGLLVLSLARPGLSPG